MSIEPVMFQLSRVSETIAAFLYVLMTAVHNFCINLCLLDIYGERSLVTGNAELMTKVHGYTLKVCFRLELFEMD
jgi:hypothetical protein